MPSSDQRHVLVALAWPYANGSLHLGHIAAFLGADVLARYHRLKGDSVLFVSGSDCYGTPIAVEAAVRGVPPASIAAAYHEEFKKTLIDDLSFSYDRYAATTDPFHAELVRDLFLRLHECGHIYTKKDIVLFSPSLNRFLPDRFVEGTCPHCGYGAARGDQCDGCGRLLEALSLKNPRANPKVFGDRAVRGDRLEERESEHFYLRLSAFQDKIERFVRGAGEAWRPQAAQFTRKFVEQGLRDRAVTRDTDWGIDIPIDGYEGKKIYVWFEAVLGYLSASKQCGDGDDWKKWWLSDDAHHYYVHGKDNVLFHTVILPAILMGSDDNLHLPDAVFSSEHLLLEGDQFSTSRGHAVWAPDFCASFDPELLRYFLLAQGPETSDTNFQWSSFMELVNGELIGTFGNLVNRVCSFVGKYFPDGVSAGESLDDPTRRLRDAAERTPDDVGACIERGEFRRAFRRLFELAEEGNRFAQQAEPWKVFREDKGRSERDLAALLQVIDTLAVAAQPFLPETSRAIQSFFGSPTAASGAGDATPGSWGRTPPESFTVRSAAPLFQKVEEEAVGRQLEKIAKEK